MIYLSLIFDIDVIKLLLLELLGKTEKSQKTVSTFFVTIIKYNPFAACPLFLRSAQDFGIPVATTAVLLIYN